MTYVTVESRLGVGSDAVTLFRVPGLIGYTPMDDRTMGALTSFPVS